MPLPLSLPAPFMEKATWQSTSVLAWLTPICKEFKTETLLTSQSGLLALDTGSSKVPEGRAPPLSCPLSATAPAERMSAVRFLDTRFIMTLSLLWMFLVFDAGDPEAIPRSLLKVGRQTVAYSASIWLNVKVFVASRPTAGFPGSLVLRRCRVSSMLAAN